MSDGIQSTQDTSRLGKVALIAVLIAASALPHIIGAVSASFIASQLTGASEFAGEVRARQLLWVGAFNLIAFPVVTAITVTYLWRFARHIVSGDEAEAEPATKARVLSTSAVLAIISCIPWVSAAVVFPLLTVLTFGQWQTELFSQQVITPLVGGALSVTSCYFALELVMRRWVIERFFPRGGLSDVGAIRGVGVRGRLVLLSVAIGLLPMFTMLGVAVSAEQSVSFGTFGPDSFREFVRVLRILFIAFAGAGALLVFLVARSLTSPLESMAQVVSAARANLPAAPVSVVSRDEVGLLAEGVNSLLASLQENSRILDTFGRVVEPEVRDRLLDGDLATEGESKWVAVVFVDIRGFTTLAEHLPPAATVEFLNEFFQRMTEIIRRYSGHVDKFIGDAVLAVFGLFDEGERNPTDRAVIAKAAVEAAVAMARQAGEVKVPGGPIDESVSIAVGVHGGEVVAGRLGARERFEYTVVGDTVNVTERVSKLTKEYNARILVTDEIAALPIEHRDQFGFRSLGLVQIRGRKEGIGLCAIDT